MTVHEGRVGKKGEGWGGGDGMVIVGTLLAMRRGRAAGGAGLCTAGKLLRDINQGVRSRRYGAAADTKVEMLTMGGMPAFGYLVKSSTMAMVRFGLR